MKLAFFQPPPSLRKGGLELAVSGLAEALRKHGCEVAVDSDWNESSPPDLAHFHGLWQPAHYILSQKCRAHGIPYVISPHGMLEPWAWRHKWWKKFPYFHFFEKSRLEKSSSLLSTSPLETARLRELFSTHPIFELPLGIHSPIQPDYENARLRLNWDKDEIVFVFLSRIDPKKGLDLLLQGLARSRNEKSRWRLVIIGGGDPDYLSQIKQWEARLSAGLPRVEWKGEIWGEEKWDYLRGADLFCLPSHSENFGYAILEALLAGAPVLCSTQTPWKHWISPQLLFSVKPNPDSVQQEIERFATSRPNRKIEDRIESSDSIRNRFDWNTLGPSYLDFYRQLIQAARSNQE